MKYHQNSYSFQGIEGANSHLAGVKLFPKAKPIACLSFEAAFQAVEDGEADLALIPIENSSGGRVADIHQILPHITLHIVDEYMFQVQHLLLGIKGSKLGGLKQVLSHTQALTQCRGSLAKLKLEALAHFDTAAAAREIKKRNDPSVGAIASSLACEIYDLEVLQENFQDNSKNTTRFLILSKDEAYAKESTKNVITAIFLCTRSIPAALYKCLGGFATNGINLTKLESYIELGSSKNAYFYLEVAGHVNDPNVRLALDELRLFADPVRILGCFQAHDFRHQIHQKGSQEDSQENHTELGQEDKQRG